MSGGAASRISLPKLAPASRAPPSQDCGSLSLSSSAEGESGRKVLVEGEPAKPLRLLRLAGMSGKIDNNRVENAIRPTAIGKKNWLFIGEAGASERGAILYTIVECCRPRGIDPYSYIRDVLTRLPDMTNRQVPQVIPAAWAKARFDVPPLKVAS